MRFLCKRGSSNEGQTEIERKGPDKERSRGCAAFFIDEPKVYQEKPSKANPYKGDHHLSHNTGAAGSRAVYRSSTKGWK